MSVAPSEAEAAMEYRVEVRGNWLVIECLSEECRLERLRVEYVVGPLAYDKPEPRGAERRRVVELLQFPRVLPRGAAIRLRLRDAERVEKVCVEVGGLVKCYQV